MATTNYIKTNHSTANRNSVFTALDFLVNNAQNLLVNQKFNAIRSIAKKIVLSILAKITRGQLTIVSSGEVYDFGQPYVLKRVDGPDKDLKGRIEVTDDRFWVRIFLHTDLGFADSYMLQEIEVDSLGDVFRIFILNRKSLSEMSTFISPLMHSLSYLANFAIANSVSESMANISAHYDLSNEMFAGFLSWDMTYSCGIFPSPTSDYTSQPIVAPPRSQIRSTEADDLEQAQMAKLEFIIKRGRIHIGGSGKRVLEIGSGWGSFSILAAGTYGARVDTLTLSHAQKAAADESIQALGLQNLITVHVMDYRCMPQEWKGQFDVVVSIGVMEHVGAEYMKEWFRIMSWAMKEEGSIKVFTMSTIPDTRWKQYTAETDFVRRYIFPGGYLSSVKTLVGDITAAGLNVNSIENIGPHYARTLREWSFRFIRNFKSHIKPALKIAYPELADAEIEIFRRKWIYYFAYTEAGFSMRNIADHVFVITRDANLNI